MKKAIAIFAAASMMCLMLSGCNNNDDPMGGGSSSQNQSSAQTDGSGGNSTNGGMDDVTTGGGDNNEIGSGNDNIGSGIGDDIGNGGDESSEASIGDVSPTETDSTNETITVNASEKLIGWGMGKERDSDNRPLDAVSANKKYSKYDAVFVDETDEKKLYLTFDEGYENGYTSTILDILKKSGVKATFFVTYDYCKNSPDLVQRMIDEGNIVGNHSYTHASFPLCSEKEVRDEIMSLHEYVAENFNYEMKFIRFPKGEFSEKSLQISQDCGYKTVFWSFAHVDWDTDAQPTVKDAFETITSQTHKGAVYLLHAVSKANTDCLSDVIDYWKNNNFTVAELTELN